MSISSLRFNSLTKEIEIRGSESFIESNFFKIYNLLIESFVGTKTRTSRETPADKEPQITDEIKGPNVSEACEKLLNAEQETSAVPPEPIMKRPPVRKYFNTLGEFIRSEDTSINNDHVVDLDKKTPEGVSATSLKEKFGLSEQQIEGIIREAEKQGRIQKDIDGSYIWM